MHDTAERLLTTIRKHDLLRAGDRVAAAVSAGADSVALLLLLDELRAELGIVLSVAHVNHKLRGTESDGDEQFVRELAARLGLECDVAVAPADSATDSPTETAGARRAKPNLEAAARDLRYNFFRELAERGRANKIVTAHTLDDQAETVLLRMFRGTGVRGLAGIRRVSPCRPPLKSSDRFSLSGAPSCAITCAPTTRAGARIPPTTIPASRAIACASACCR